MQILLVRHAVAAPRGPGVVDASRRLTPEGRERFAEVVKGLRRLGVKLDRIYHSPWTRAVETADLLTAVLRGETEAHPALARSPNRALLASLHGERIAAVGHEPWLSELAALLLLGDKDRSAAFELKKGGVIWLEGEPRAGGMHLVAFLPPRSRRR